LASRLFWAKQFGPEKAFGRQSFFWSFWRFRLYVFFFGESILGAMASQFWSQRRVNLGLNGESI
jgi:hypothetical protein